MAVLVTEILILLPYVTADVAGQSTPGTEITTSCLFDGGAPSAGQKCAALVARQGYRLEMAQSLCAESPGSHGVATQSSGESAAGDPGSQGPMHYAGTLPPAPGWSTKDTGGGGLVNLA